MMSHRYSCAHCGKRSPSSFLTFLHCFTDHLHSNVGLLPQESKNILGHNFEQVPQLDSAYWKLHQIVVNSPLWIERN